MSYEWNESVQQILYEKTKDSDRNFGKFDGGCDCKAFVPITDTVAIKLYKRCEYRNIAWRFQRLADRHGLAPKTGDKFRCKLHGRIYYGYITQIAQMDRDRFDAIPDAYKQLRDDYATIGLFPDDICHFNSGFIGDKLVMIDFGLVYKYKEVRKKKLSVEEFNKIRNGGRTKFK